MAPLPAFVKADIAEINKKYDDEMPEENTEVDIEETVDDITYYRRYNFIKGKWKYQGTFNTDNNLIETSKNKKRKAQNPDRLYTAIGILDSITINDDIGKAKIKEVKGILAAFADTVTITKKPRKKSEYNAFMSMALKDVKGGDHRSRMKAVTEQWRAQKTQHNGSPSPASPSSTQLRPPPSIISPLPQRASSLPLLNGLPTLPPIETSRSAALPASSSAPQYVQAVLPTMLPTPGFIQVMLPVPPAAEIELPELPPLSPPLDDDNAAATTLETLALTPAGQDDKIDALLAAALDEAF